MHLSYPTLEAINRTLKIRVIPTFDWRNSQYLLYNLPNRNSHPDITGLDIPVLVSPEEIRHDEIIVLLGQDPMRSISKMSKEMPKEMLPNNFIVGLPFGAHDGKRNVSNVWCDDTLTGSAQDGIITSLLKAGYQVHLTNSYKIYEGTLNEDNKQVPSLKHNKANRLFYMNLFNDEICELSSSYKIKKIAAFGTIAKSFVDNLNRSNQFGVAYIEHPSGANRYWNGYTYEEKINTIVKSII